MIDKILILLSINILALFGIEYFDLHGFGLESALSVLSAILVAYLHWRARK